MIDGHGGNVWRLAAEMGCSPSEITDMSSNVNPLGPPDGLLDLLKEKIDAVLSLPEADAGSAVRAFAERHGLPPEQVIAGNGTTQLIHTIPLALQSRKALIVGPTYADYVDACRMHDIPFDFFMTTKGDAFQPALDRLTAAAWDADTVFICNPNNPTGVLIPAAKLTELCRAAPESCFIIDESYLPFARDGEAHSMMGRDLPNLMVLNSMSKIFRVPGLRIGFLTSANDDLIRKMARYALPWSLNSLSQLAVRFLMSREAETDAFIEKTRRFLAAERRFFVRALEDIPEITAYPSQTSFVLIELSGDLTAELVCAALGRERILIRNCANFAGLSERFVRVSLKETAENRRVVGVLAGLGGIAR